MTGPTAGTSSVGDTATLDSLPGLAWLADEGGRPTFFSRGWDAYAGRRPSGDDWLDLLHPDDRPGVRAAWRGAIRTGSPFRAGFRLRGADGGYRRFFARADPRRTDGGLAFLGLALEAAAESGAPAGEPGPAEETPAVLDQLRACEERNRLLNLATHDVIYEWDFLTDRVSWNEGVETTFGYRRDEVRGDLAWWEGRVHPDDHPRILADLRTVIENPAARFWSEEYRFRHRDGRWLAVLDRGYVVRDDRGRGVRMIGSVLDLTERKRAEEALRRSEAKFRYLTDAMPQLVWTTKPDGSPEYLNQQWVAFTGTTEKDVTGLDWLRLIHPDDRERTLKRWRHSLETGEPYEIEYRFRRAGDGAYFWFLTRANAVRDDHGRIVRWFGTSTNIEDRKQAEAALEEARALFRDRLAELEQIYRHAPVGLLTLDREYRYQRLNERLAEMNGRTVEEHLGKTIDEVVPELAAFLRRELAPAMERGEPVQVEIHGPTAKAPGVDRDWLANYFPLRTASGEIVGVIGAVLEVTERKRAEEALARSEEKYRGLFLNLTEEVAFWRLERAGPVLTWRVIDANPSALRAWGKTLEEVEGRTPDEILGPGTTEFFRPTIERALRRGVPETSEQHFPRTDRYLRATIVPMGDGFITTAADVTGLRRALVLADEAAARLREVDRRKDEFLAMLSHELRNPLAPLRTSVYLLGRAPPGSEPARHALAVIDRQVQHLTRLIDDLLDVTRISRGKIRLQTERLDLRDVALRTAEDHREELARGGVAFAVRVEPAPLYVRGDATRLAQVIGNLLGNAAKFTPPGGQVELALERSGDRAVLRVRDTGAGIAPELAERLFDPFVQGAQTIDRTRGGLGLGLALVKGLAEMHGGSASVASEGPGRGSTFTVELPLDRTAQPRPAAPAAPTPAKRTRRVLVVEDNVDAAETLKDVMQFDGHRVELAGSGPEALEKARSFSPEVIFCDIGLPGMNGYEVARALREIPGRQDMYLVALSGYAAPEDVQRAREAGFDEHLAKPVDLEALERVLAGERGGDGGGRFGGGDPAAAWPRGGTRNDGLPAGR